MDYKIIQLMTYMEDRKISFYKLFELVDNKTLKLDGETIELTELERLTISYLSYSMELKTIEDEEEYLFISDELNAVKQEIIRLTLAQ
ncbi:MAG: hypothetical protein ACRC2K_13385 [Clostridium sp.]